MELNTLHQTEYCQIRCIVLLVLQTSKGFSVERFPLPSRKRVKLVSALCCDLRSPASTQMIDGTGKPKIPSKFAKRAARYNEFNSKTHIVVCTICTGLGNVLHLLYFALGTGNYYSDLVHK